MSDKISEKEIRPQIQLIIQDRARKKKEIMIPIEDIKGMRVDMEDPAYHCEHIFSFHAMRKIFTDLINESAYPLPI